MAVTQSSRLGRSCVLGTGLVLGAAGCTRSPQPRIGLTEMQPEAFAPTLAGGIHGFLTDRRSYDASVSGTPIRTHEEQTLRWKLRTTRQGRSVIVDEELAHVMLKHGGATLVDRDVEPGAVAGEFIVDRTGAVSDVTGLEGAPAALRLQPGSDAATYAEEVLAAPRLRGLIAARYYQTIADIGGRPAGAGATWSTDWERSPGHGLSPVTTRTVTVEGPEGCGSTTCTRLRTSYKLAPRLLADEVSAILDFYAQTQGAPVFKPVLKGATYSMNGMVLTDPVTLVSRQAALTETGGIRIASGERQFQVKVAAKSQVIFEPAPEVVGRLIP